MDEVRDPAVRLPDDQRMVRRLATGPTRLTVLAQHRRTGHRSVIVTCPPSLGSAPSEAVAALGHPHILPLRMTEPGMLSAQVPEGAELVAFAPNGGSPAADVAVLAQVADALDAAHRVGAVHGDLRAEDALIDVRTGHVCLAGFGLFAPATQASPAGDQRALGAVLTRCLPPHQPALAEVLHAAYAARYPTCRALVDAAAAALPGQAPVPPSPKRSRRSMIGAAVALVVVLLAGIAVTPYIVASFGPTDGELTRMPAAVRGACALTGPDGLPPGSTRQLRCHGADSQEMTAGLYESAADAEAGYRAAVAATPAARTGDGDCSASPGWEHSYPGVGVPTGRVLCVRDNTGARMVWLDRTDRTVSVASRSDGDALALYQAWARWVEVPVFPAAQEKDLAGLLKEQDCRRTPAGVLDQMDGVTAGLDCTPTGVGAATARYLQFTDDEHLNRAYQSAVDSGGPDKDRRCPDPANPSELIQMQMSVLGVPVGQAVCAVRGATTTATWTVGPLHLLGVATGTDRTALSVWLNSAASPRRGVIAPALNRQTQFPAPSEEALLRHIPEAAKVQCVRTDPQQVTILVKDAQVTSVSCGTNSLTDALLYFQYTDRTRLAAELGAGGGPDCTTNPPRFLGSARYSRPDGATGMLNCGPTTSNPAVFCLEWSDERTGIRALAFGPDPARLIAWWNANGGLR